MHDAQPMMGWAGSYLGSFLARAKYLKLSNIEVTLRLLVTWILEYMDKESAVQGPDPIHHSLFYRQALTRRRGSRARGCLQPAAWRTRRAAILSRRRGRGR